MAPKNYFLLLLHLLLSAGSEFQLPQSTFHLLNQFAFSTGESVTVSIQFWARTQTQLGEGAGPEKLLAWIRSKR